jgi:hypothetical protein
MAVSSPQPESSEDMPFLGPEESKQRYKDVIHEKRSNGNEITEVNDDELRRLQEEGWCGIQKATTSSQSEPVNGRRVLVTKESRRHRDGVVNTRHSYTNIVPGVDDDETSRLSKEMVNE